MAISAHATKDKVQQFAAKDYSNEVSGVVFDGKQIKKSFPLGGLGTGYIGINGDGMLGQYTVFSNFMVPKLKITSMDVPFLFLKVKDANYVLSTEAVGDWIPAKKINFWGHFPIADLEYETDLPLSIRLQAFSPLVPGNETESNIPATVFKLKIRNSSTEQVDFQSIFAFPGVEEAVGRISTAPNEKVSKDRTEMNEPLGVKFHFSELTHLKKEFDFFTGVLTKDIQDKSQLVNHPLQNTLSEGWMEGTSSACATDVHLEPGEEVEIPYIVSWFSAAIFTYDTHPHYNRYTHRFADSVDVVKYMETNYNTLYSRIVKWQDAIYGSEYPGWLQDLLINSLYSLTRNTFYFTNTKKDSWWGSEGLFTHNESMDGCCIQESMVCRMHGHFPALFLYPNLEKTTLDAFQHYQLLSGEVPFAFGQGTGIEGPVYHRQHPLNTSEYIQMIYRYYLRTGDKNVLSQYYPAVRRGMDYMLTLDTDGDQLVNEHSYALPGSNYPANQFYDIWPWQGTSAYVAGIWLATLKCAEAIALELDDAEQAKSYREKYEVGLQSYMNKLWNGSYLRLFNDPSHDHADESILSNQLMLEWCSEVAGLGAILPDHMIQSSLQQIQNSNASKTEYGIINASHPEGKLDSNDHATKIFIGEIWCVCMTLMYKGHKELGMKYAEEIYQALIENGHLWDQHCIIESTDGAPVWGNNYYSNLVAWAIPMAYKGEDIVQFSASSFLQSILAQGDSK